MTRNRSTPGSSKKGGITLRILLDHMQHHHVLVEKNFDDVRKQLRTLRSDMEHGFAEVNNRLVRVERSVRNIEAQLDDVQIELMPARFERLEKKVGIAQ